MLHFNFLKYFFGCHVETYHLGLLHFFSEVNNLHEILEQIMLGGQLATRVS